MLLKETNIEELARSEKPPTVRQLVDYYAEQVLRHSKSLRQAAGKMGITERGLRIRAGRTETAQGLKAAHAEKGIDANR